MLWASEQRETIFQAQSSFLTRVGGGGEDEDGQEERKSFVWYLLAMEWLCWPNSFNLCHCSQLQKLHSHFSIFQRYLISFNHVYVSPLPEPSPKLSTVNLLTGTKCFPFTCVVSQEIEKTVSKCCKSFVIIIFSNPCVLWSCGYFVVLTTEAETVRMNGTEQGNIMEAINRQSASQCNPGN